MDTSDALRLAGYNVLEASSADEAVRILRSGVSLSLVFTDVQMPGTMDGLALAMHVRDHYPGTGCVITSANFSAFDIPLSAPWLLIPKPYLYESVVEALDRNLPTPPQMRQLGSP